MDQEGKEVVVVCKTSGEMKWKSKKAKIIFEVLWVTVALVVIARMTFKIKKEEYVYEILSWAMLGFVVAMILLKIFDHFFPKWFKDRPTREELE